MRVHHLNCATLCPVLGWLTGIPERLVCHCLLVEADDGLVLVDTGLGEHDLQDPRARLGARFLAATRPGLDSAETAISHVTRLGFSPTDVRHIVLTHLDLDHAGGLDDFPQAAVHVYDAEYRAAMQLRTPRDQMAYRPIQWASKPHWVTHIPGGSRWFELDCVSVDSELPGVLLVPMPGHTRGHCAVAIEQPDGWLLHCGDGYFSAMEMDREHPRCPVGWRAFQRMVQLNGPQRKKSQKRFRELAASHPEVRLFCSHDGDEFDRFARSAGDMGSIDSFQGR